VTPPPARPNGRRSQWSRDVEKYLLDDEPPVLVTSRHWAVLLVPVTKFLPAFVLGGWLFLLDPRNHLTSAVGLVILLGAMGYLGLRIAEWRMRHFIVTRRRVLLTSGVLVRTVTLLPLRRVTDLTWKETAFGQLLGYGTFRFESAGQHQALSEITFLPHADALYKQVSGLLFSSDWGPASGGDDEGNPDPPPPDERRDTQPIPGPPPPQ
jgi:membrane protein YdbS with pleckstrin-like domain